MAPLAYKHQLVLISALSHEVFFFLLRFDIELTHDNLPVILGKSLDVYPGRRHRIRPIISACHLCWATPKLGRFEIAFRELSFLHGVFWLQSAWWVDSADLPRSLDWKLSFSHLQFNYIQSSRYLCPNTAQFYFQDSKPTSVLHWQDNNTPGHLETTSIKTSCHASFFIPKFRTSRPVQLDKPRIPQIRPHSNFSRFATRGPWLLQGP